MGQVARQGANKVQRASFHAQLDMWDRFASICQNFLFQKVRQTIVIPATP